MKNSYEEKLLDVVSALVTEVHHNIKLFTICLIAI